MNGYYLSPSFQCDLCEEIMPGCIFCDNSSACVQCEAGYYLENANCFPC